MQPHGAAALLCLLPYAAVHSYNHGGTLESVSVSIYIIIYFYDVYFFNYLSFYAELYSS